CTTQRAAGVAIAALEGRVAIGADRDLTRVLVSRVRKQVVDRDTRLEVHGGAHGEALHVVVSKRVAHKAVRQVTDVSVEHARAELTTEQVELTLREVKQRADVRVVLAVVITERTFVVAEQLGNTVVRAHLPVLGERLVDFELHRLVDADRIDETVRDPVRAGQAGNGRVGYAERIVSGAIDGTVAVAIGRNAYARGVGVHGRIARRASRSGKGSAAVECELDGVDEDILGLARVTDQVVLVEAALEGFRRQGSHIFDDALDTTIRIARREDDARVAELVLHAHHVFVEVLTASTGSEAGGALCRDAAQRSQDEAAIGIGRGRSTASGASPLHAAHVDGAIGIEKSMAKIG